MYEIRNYHIKPEVFSDYINWAKNIASPYLKANLDVLGFWVNSEPAPDVGGEVLDPLGSSNVTWIIRWQDMTQRKQKFAEVFTNSAEWNHIFSQVPGGNDSYLRREAKFTENV